MKEKLVKLTALMHQAQECISFGTYVEVDSRGTKRVQVSFEDKFTEYAKALEAEVKCEHRDFIDYPYLWSFTYNGVTFFTYSNEVYTDAETTTEPEQV